MLPYDYYKKFKCLITMQNSLAVLKKTHIETQLWIFKNENGIFDDVKSIHLCQN